MKMTPTDSHCPAEDFTALDALLHRRRMETPDESLTARIIAAALTQPQQLPLSLREWLAHLFAEFRLPRPAYALASLLFLGLMIGAGIPTVPALPQASIALTVAAPGATAEAKLSERLIRTVFYPEEELL